MLLSAHYVSSSKVDISVCLFIFSPLHLCLFVYLFFILHRFALERNFSQQELSQPASQSQFRLFHISSYVVYNARMLTLHVNMQDKIAFDFQRKSDFNSFAVKKARVVDPWSSNLMPVSCRDYFLTSRGHLLWQIFSVRFGTRAQCHRLEKIVQKTPQGRNALERLATGGHKNFNQGHRLNRPNTLTEIEKIENVKNPHVYE